MLPPPPNPAFDDEPPPHDAKSFVFEGMEGGFTVLAFEAVAVVEAGSGVAQASLEPHGSAVEKPENAIEAGGADFEGA